MKSKTQQTKSAEIPTLVLCILYIVIGITSFYFGRRFHSVTLQSSGIDSLVGSLTEGLLLFGLIASRDTEVIDDGFYFSYGHWRSTIIMNLLVSLLIFYGGCQVLYDGVISLIDFFKGQKSIPDPSTIMVAGIVMFALVVVLGLFWLIARKNSSSSLQESMLDLKSDLMTNTMVIVAVIAARQFNIYWIDGTFGIIIGLIIVKGSMEIFRTAILYLLDATPKKQIAMYEEAIDQVGGFKKIDSLKTHWVGDGLVILDLVIQVNQQMTIEQADQLKQRISDEMKRFEEVSYLNIVTTARP